MVKKRLVDDFESCSKNMLEILALLEIRIDVKRCKYMI